MGMKARITINLSVSDTDKDGIEALVKLKKEIENGRIQQEFMKGGARKATATFEYIDKGRNDCFDAT